MYGHRVLTVCTCALQSTLAEASDSPLWLSATQSHSGVVGMVNCLKQEPGGNRVR